MRVLGVFLMTLAFLLYIDMRLARWASEPHVHPWIIVAIFIFGAMITYYDYRYNVIPAMKDTKICPYCSKELWIDEESGGYYCRSCDRNL